MTTETVTSLRELDCRMTDGISVRLLWCQTSNRVYVAVEDGRTGDAFSLEVPEGERPLHVFDHPYAYMS